MNDPGAAHAVRFEQLHRAMALFAQGLGGRAKAVQLEGEGAGDAQAIRLPAVTDDFGSRRENHGACRVAVLRQLGDADAAPEFHRWPRPTLARRVYRWLERLRIDSVIERRYPGAVGDLQRVRAHALARRAPVCDEARPMHSVIDGLARFTLGAGRSDSVDSVDPLGLADPVGLVGAVDPTGRTQPRSNPMLDRILDLAATVQAEAADARHSLRVTAAICAVLDAAARPRRATSFVEATGEAPYDGLRAGRVDGDAPDGDSTNGDAGDGGWSAALAFNFDAADADPPAKAQRSATSAPSSPPPAATHSYFHDEWDHTARRYLPDWCQVRERRLRGDNIRFLHDLRERHAVLRGEVRHRFAAIRPAFRQRVHRRLDGDEIDLDAAIAEAVERRAGRLAEGRVFIAAQQPRRDVCAAFLVDMSGSTGFLVPDAMAQAASEDDDDDDYLYQGRVAMRAAQRPARRRVIDIAADALGLMCDALHELGDRHAVYGFSGEGRHNVAFHVAKAFDDPWSARTAAALAAMQPMGATRTGAAIRHATMRLAREPAATRVLIVVSDGYPQDSDYGPVRGDAAYGIHDTARALREAEQSGIDTFCIAIDPAGHDYLRTTCAPDRYLVIDDVSALPAQLGKVYRALTVR
ncbi:nitric oxide reductase activation protein NorD [Variovorax sp. dw_308]|uniref:nitric oxide reductase activation protein NorD n=1 Tax=Variovorax sp. dw_308 TaxID=2721546 RepID=UPI001C447B9A|nr:VWA domain-containing protein [Variovorax sp. dw_308]